MKKSIIIAIMLALGSMSNVSAESELTAAAKGEKLSLSLDESIELALENNNQIKAAEAGRDANKFGWSSARRQTGAGVNWNSQSTRTREKTLTGKYSYSNAFSNSWNLTVPIYTGGQLEGQIDKTRYQLNRADLNLENIKQSVRYKTASAYANLLHQKDVCEIAKKSVEMADSQMRLINDQYSEGAVAKADVLMMEVRLANNRQSLISAQGSYDVAQQNLVNAMGLAEDVDVEPADVFSYEQYSYELADCLDYAKTHRPDGVAADYGIKLADANKDIAKAAYFPKVTGGLGDSISGDKPFSSERTNSLTISLGITWSIFDNGVTAANVAQADALKEQSEEEAEQIKKNIKLETQSAFIQMKTAEKNIAVAKDAVRDAEESYMIAQVRYEEGVDILLNLLDAQEKLTQARSNYSNALYQYNLARVTLEKAMGVPVELDVPRYVEAENQGKSPDKAVEIATIH